MKCHARKGKPEGKQSSTASGSRTLQSASQDNKPAAEDKAEEAEACHDTLESAGTISIKGNQEDLDLFAQQENRDNTEFIALAQSLMADNSADLTHDDVEPGKAQFNAHAICGIQQSAISSAENDYAIFLTDDGKWEAKEIIPKVCLKTLGLLMVFPYL